MPTASCSHPPNKRKHSHKQTEPTPARGRLCYFTVAILAMIATIAKLFHDNFGHGLALTADVKTALGIGDLDTLQVVVLCRSVAVGDDAAYTG